MIDEKGQGTEVEKYDPSKLMEMVRDRIRATYVSMVPEEQWSQMVQKEIDIFFKEQSIWKSSERLSPFSVIVHNELEKKAREVAQEFLSTISSHNWTNGAPAPGDFVKQLFAEKSGEILLNVLGSMVQNAINSAQHQSPNCY